MTKTSPRRLDFHLEMTEMPVAEMRVLATDEVWTSIKHLLGEGLTAWRDSVNEMIASGNADSVYIYTRSGGQKVHSIPLGATGYDAIVVYRQRPDDPLVWGWIAEQVLLHEHNKLAKMSPGEAAILRLVGPWMNGR
jgi:hypothetical protein